MTESGEGLTTPGLAALKQERAARKAADSKVKELRDELRIMRDRADLWEYRATRYSNERDQYKTALTRISEMS